jgi:molybdopterin-biosynthesis enzyme MoeA-like protein
MGFGLYVIGDEILSGRREDKHFARVRELLAARGLRLDWVSYLGDDRTRLTAAFRASLAGEDIVFSCGGIGVTPDDHTRQAVAAALGVDCVLHPDAEREIRARFGAETTARRLMLGEFPRGVRIIINPFNRIPGFSVGQHHFLPGFPEMAWPMIEAVLDTDYAPLHHADGRVEASFRVFEAHEGELIPLMEAVQADYGVTVFSLPSFGGAGLRRHVELGAKGTPAAVAAAVAHMREAVRGMGLETDEGEAA